MKLSDVDRVHALRNYRQKLLLMHRDVQTGYLYVKIDDEDLSSQLDITFIREATKKEIELKIEEYNRELLGLGVTINE